MTPEQRIAKVQRLLRDVVRHFVIDDEACVMLGRNGPNPAFWITVQPRRVACMDTFNFDAEGNMTSATCSEGRDDKDPEAKRGHLAVARAEELIDKLPAR